MHANSLPPPPPAFLQKPFVFRAPTHVRMVGSFGLKAAAAPAVCIDVAVEMPAACFNEKDRLNHRCDGSLTGLHDSGEVSMFRSM